MLPHVSVIVPSYNAGPCIESLLNALQAQSYPVTKREFIIVDDASTDDTAKFIVRHPAHPTLIRNMENLGSYYARNCGTAVATGTVLAFTDADCVPKHDWLECGVQALQAQGSGIIAGAVSIPIVNANSAIQHYDMQFGIQQAFFATVVGFGATANVFICRSDLLELDGFDARLRSGGDRQLCERSTLAGKPFSYCPDAKVEHEPRCTYRELAAKQVRISLGQARVLKRWSRLHILPLRHRSAVSFDKADFSSKSIGFKLRFRCVYYSLECLHVLVYGFGCLKLHIYER